MEDKDIHELIRLLREIRILLIELKTVVVMK